MSRSLAACEGAILVVDAAQGVEAQTVANVYLALDNDLAIVPVLNKIDLPAAEPDRVRKEIEDVIGLDASEAVLASAKSGQGTEEVLEAVVRTIPPPTGDAGGARSQALLFDSWFDPYHGAVMLVRVFDGTVRAGHAHPADGDRQGGRGQPPRHHEADARRGRRARSGRGRRRDGRAQGGRRHPGRRHHDRSRSSGRDAAARASRPCSRWCSPGSTRPSRTSTARCATRSRSCKLNDSSLTYEAESSVALGFGFRCGFLGLLHMEIVQERLEREFGLTLITTAPTVAYHVHTTDGRTLVVDSPAKLPPEGRSRAWTSRSSSRASTCRPSTSAT